MQYFALPAADRFPVFNAVLAHFEVPGIWQFASRLLSPTLFSARVPRRLYNFAADLAAGPHPALLGAMAAMELPVGTHWIEVEGPGKFGHRHAAAAEVSRNGEVNCMSFTLKQRRSVTASPCVATRASDVQNAALAPRFSEVERNREATGGVDPVLAMEWFSRSVHCEVPDLLHAILSRQLSLFPPVASRAETAAAMQALALVAIAFSPEFAALRTSEPDPA